MSAKKQCLIVDDSEIIREIAMRIVADLGFEPAQAENAAMAIEFCRDCKPDVILLDWDLPSMGALDFLRGAADLGYEYNPEIILCATENDLQQFTLAKAAGASHHLLKPFDKTVIEAKFREIGLLEGAVEAAKAAANE